MSAPNEMKPLRILVVENHADTARWLALYLEDLGHSVAVARTRAEGAALLAGAEWDALISDIGLPDGTGWELLEQTPLRRPLFAIAMSGFGMNADSARSRAAGYRHHLLKPFKISELDKLLEEAAASASAA